MRPMDSYDAFYDEYCAFMVEYNKNTYHLTLLSLYGDMMTKLADMAEKFESWNEDEMSDTDLNYYLEVNNRVAQKRLEVS